MHADEVDTDAALVRRLLAGQFPRWAELPISLVVSYGTDHHIYRLGDELVARLPRIAWATDQAAKEAEWLPKLAPHLPLELYVTIGPSFGMTQHWWRYPLKRWLFSESNSPSDIRTLQSSYKPT